MKKQKKKNKWNKTDVLIIIVICIIASMIFIKKNEKKEYIYLTYNDSQGVSYKCSIDEIQRAYCYVDNEILIVKQFYEK